MKKDYHDYVFKDNQFVGKFEEMYQNETTNYDSWNQTDLRDYGYLISLSILNQYNFKYILDIGCGKGLFTSLLKKKNNIVIGWDISKTAIEKARNTYKDIAFVVRDISENVFLPNVDLIVLKEVLSYIKNWKEVLQKIVPFTNYIFVTLDLPEHPIGFVKSFDELLEEIEKNYNIIIKVKIDTKGQQMLILGEVK